MIRTILSVLFAIGTAQSAHAATLRVPQDHQTIQAAIDASNAGDTITNVGAYDDALWRKHFDSHGEELGDEEGSVQAEGTTPAISIRGVSCTVAHCIVHHNGDVGIGILGMKDALFTPKL